MPIFLKIFHIFLNAVRGQLGGMKKGARYGPFFMRKLSVFLPIKASVKSERKELYITAFRFNLNSGIFLNFPFFKKKLRIPCGRSENKCFTKSVACQATFLIIISV